MYFDSLQFLVFFVVVYCLYVCLNHRLQNRMLLVASYVFYGAWDYRFLSLIIISTVVDYFCGIIIDKSQDGRIRRRFLTLSVVTNLGFLGFFKYFNFFIGSLEDLFSIFNLPFHTVSLNIILPVGISFYTFQTMSYTIDIYRRKMKPCHNFLDFALFVSFFPQLVAGPIERAKQLIPQITSPRQLTVNGFTEGFYLIMWGLLKKVVIADNLAITVEQVFSKTSGFAPGEVFIGVLFFTFQIYCDFSSYTDIARGISRILGFELMINFHLPYFAQNPGEFWRRWHISLSTWLRDYLYIPLGGNKNGTFNTFRNLMITMLLGGVWHGAAWNFLFWGLYHGLLLSGHRIIKQVLDRAFSFESLLLKTIVKYSSIFLMFLFTLYGWLLFRANGLEQVVHMSRDFFPTSFSPYLLTNIKKLIFYAWPLLIVELFQYYLRDLRIVLKSPVIVQTGFYLACFYLIIVLGNYDGPSFIYFQF